MADLYRCEFQPLPDITSYELALLVKHAGPSFIVADYQFPALGSALRHLTFERPIKGTYGRETVRLDTLENPNG